ncbi:MAG: hypothetical protein KDI09_17940 [Halioglobus sp.]|nr:hypothetical protein [Halioglobus sp.]
MEALPNFGLANTVTGFATLFSGLLPLLLTRLMYPQPARWVFAYWMIVVTGVFTVTLHGFGETNPVWGERWFWGFLDTGSNIVVTWAMALAIVGDFYRPSVRRWAIPVLTAIMLVGVGWHYYDRLPETPRTLVIALGEWGGFYPGETWLIGFSWLNVGLFAANWRAIPPPARPLLLASLAVFFCGMLLASASNDKIIYPFIPMHALWHLVSAYGFIIIWAFNHQRFSRA